MNTDKKSNEITISTPDVDIRITDIGDKYRITAEFKLTQEELEKHVSEKQKQLIDAAITKMSDFFLKNFPKDAYASGGYVTAPEARAAGDRKPQEYIVRNTRID